jgi:hypothetical protein
MEASDQLQATTVLRLALVPTGEEVGWAQEPDIRVYLYVHLEDRKENLKITLTMRWILKRQVVGVGFGWN